MDPRQLAALAAVLEQGSFEQGARRLNVTQATVSQRIRQLEERLGCPVVVRSQPVRATEAGLKLYRHQQQLQLLERELAVQLPQLQESGRPRLKVAVNADSLATWFLDAVARVKDELLLDLTVEDQDVTLNRLKAGEVMAAVSAFGRPVQGCRVLPLGTMSYTAVAGPAMAERDFAGVEPAVAFRRATALVYGRHDQLVSQFLAGFGLRDTDVESHTMPAAQSFIDAALGGIAWTLVPLLQARPYLDSGQLVELSPRHRMKVPLFWHHWRLPASRLERLTAAVLQSAQLLGK
ncbi:LysR family transcriptional regulator ArgP [Gallaecimonas sp. GXIMD4217]|uniref:LysR family transcriptional regulator ArgP n=1 Tax=Gallaecimonas sp. GXIMD4217 TaxID=3131927 RepID=UPI00311AC10F